MSPTLALLAFDWPEGTERDDFLGFAIKRSPGFNGRKESWLPNRLSFDGPVTAGQDLGSNEAPIQKFMWWDNRIDETDRNKSFTYTVYPVVGTPDDMQLLDGEAGRVRATLPAHEAAGIGTWFNRGVVSSQAFARKVNQLGLEAGEAMDPADEKRLRRWLGNGMEQVLPDFLKKGDRFEGAIYHLTDPMFAIPAFRQASAAGKEIEMVYDAKPVALGGGAKAPSPNEAAIEALPGVVFHPRDKAAIMHDKFIVGLEEGEPKRLLMGSANFTTEGLTSQANVMHTFESPELAALYLDRVRLLSGNPTVKNTAEQNEGWSESVAIDGAKVRVIFAPEEKTERQAVDTVVDAIRNAKSSVVFALFAPTDEALREAAFEAGDRGLMMFGLVNRVAKAEKADEEPTDRAQLAAVELYHRSRNQRDIVPPAAFRDRNTPYGFLDEPRLFPGAQRPNHPPVIVHHKFVLIDGDTPNPTLYVGSANMSANSLHRNDENLLEIKDSPQLAHTYLAEFMRLYEHYRARAVFQRAPAAEARHEQSEPQQRWNRNSPTRGHSRTLALAEDSSWSDKYFRPGTPEMKTRIAMAGGELATQPSSGFRHAAGRDFGPDHEPPDEAPAAASPRSRRSRSRR